MLFTHLLTKFEGIEPDYNVKIPEKYLKESEEKSLTLHCRTNNGHYGLYTFNECGHTQYLQYSAVRNFTVNCETCLNIKLIGEAEKRGLTLLKRDGGIGLYRFNSCGHEISIHYTNVRNSQTFCQECYNEKIKELSSKHGLEFIERSKGVYSRFKIVKCGHIKNVANRHAFTGAYECDECIDAKYRKYATDCGIEYVGHCTPKKKDRRLFKLPCGCIITLSPHNVKRKSWSCRTHDITAFSQPSAIYLMEVYDNCSGKHFLKLGFSKNSNLRVKQYNLPETFDVKELVLIKTKSWQDACDIEKSLHKKYKYFRLHKSYVSDVMKSGFTECYPIFMKDVLIEELELVKENNKSDQLD